MYYPSDNQPTASAAHNLLPKSGWHVVQMAHQHISIPLATLIGSEWAHDPSWANESWSWDHCY